VFLAGPDAFGFRTYLTADEARQLAPTGRPSSPGSATGRRTRPAVPAAPCSSKWWCWGARPAIWWAPPAGCPGPDVSALLATMAVVIVIAAAYPAGRAPGPERPRKRRHAASE